MNKVIRIIFFLTVAMLIYVLLPTYNEPPTEESIIFFPIDPNVKFSQATTTLSLHPNKINGQYVLGWNVSSNLDRKAYLRQDISLLFANGRLKGIASKWKENSQIIVQEKDIELKDSQLFQAISFHHGEIHENSSIKSSQKMSGDQIFVVDSAHHPLASFRTAKTSWEKEWEKVLTKTTNEFVAYKTNQLINHYSIQTSKYHRYYLSDLINYNEKPFPGISIDKTKKIVGNLWEGLYKNYFLGIKKSDGTIVSPIGSTMPAVLISKDFSHLKVLFETKDGTKMLLVQQISY